MSVYSKKFESGGLHLHWNLEQIDKALQFLKTFDKQAEGPIVKALNRAAKGIRTDAVHEVRGIYNVRAKTVRGTMSLQSAHRSNSLQYRHLAASLHFHGSRIPLYEFGVRPRRPRPANPPRVGASVLVRHDTGRSKISGAFVADLPVRGRSLYYRPGKERDKVLKFYSISVPQMVQDADAQDRIVEGARERFDKNLDHEIDHFLAKKGLR